MSNKIQILLIEDEETICSFISSVLSSYDYKVVIGKNGKEGLTIAASYCPNIILLDLGLPDIDGIEVLRKLREWSHVPIIILSARHEEKEKVEALDLGADDYITKPFGTSELLARIRTALRHSIRTENRKNFTAKGLSIDFDSHIVTVDKVIIHLTQIEFKIVALLAQNAGKVLPYDKIIREIWGPYADTNNRILRVNMVNIRRKLEKNPVDPQYIFTEIGVGYRMVDEG